MSQPHSFSHEWWRTALIVVLLLALWEIGVRVSEQWSDTNIQNILPGPSKVILTGWQMLTSGQLVSHTLYSLGRVVAGYLIAAVVGVVLGVAAFQSRIAGAGIEPIVIGLRAVPPFAWIPLILLWLGVGNLLAVLIVSLGCVFTVTTFTLSGLRGLPTEFVRVAKNLGTGRWFFLVRVALPNAVPRLLTGLRLAWGLAWMVVVAAEFLGATGGLGFLIMDSRNLGRPDVVVVSMLMIGCVAAISETALRSLERYCLRWMD